jgi:two-component system OmpR family response regulator
LYFGQRLFEDNDMLLHHKVILIIDDATPNKQLLDYFAQFNYCIIHYKTVAQIQQQLITPTALLIRWAKIANDLTIINMLHQTFNTPLVIIHERYQEDICVRVLDAGADDFLATSIQPRELHARIDAINRRIQRSLKDIYYEKEVLLFANWRLYPASRQLFDNKNQELLLSVGEYALLLAFLRQPQQILNREFLLQVTKNSLLSPFDRRIDVQISRLRQKIELDAKRPLLIKTIRNNGYLFTTNVLSSKESS